MILGNANGFLLHNGFGLMSAVDSSGAPGVKSQRILLTADGNSYIYWSKYDITPFGWINQLNNEVSSDTALYPLRLICRPGETSAIDISSLEQTPGMKPSIVVMTKTPENYKRYRISTGGDISVSGSSTQVPYSGYMSSKESVRSYTILSNIGSAYDDLKFSAGATTALNKCKFICPVSVGSNGQNIYTNDLNSGSQHRVGNKAAGAYLTTFSNQFYTADKACAPFLDSTGISSRESGHLYLSTSTNFSGWSGVSATFNVRIDFPWTSPTNRVDSALNIFNGVTISNPYTALGAGISRFSGKVVSNLISTTAKPNWGLYATDTGYYWPTSTYYTVHLSGGNNYFSGSAIIP